MLSNLAELKRLMADVARYFENIRSDLNGNIGDREYQVNQLEVSQRQW